MEVSALSAQQLDVMGYMHRPQQAILASRGHASLRQAFAPVRSQGSSWSLSVRPQASSRNAAKRSGGASSGLSIRACAATPGSKASSSLHGATPIAPVEPTGGAAAGLSSPSVSRSSTGTAFAAPSGRAATTTAAVVLERSSASASDSEASSSTTDTPVRSDPSVESDAAAQLKKDNGSPGLSEQSGDLEKPTSGGLLGGPFKVLEDKLSPRIRGLILLNMLTFLYGTNVTVVKEAQSNLDPFSFSLGRFAIAALAFSPFLKRAFSCGTTRRAGIELGIWASLAYVTQSVGLITTDAGRAAFIGTFTVIEVPIIAGIFGARIPPITWWAAGAAVIGVGLLESAGGNSTFMGDFWTIVSALVFGFHMLRSEHHTRHVPADNALPLISLQLLVTAVMSLGWLIGMSSIGVVPDTTIEAILGGDWSTMAHWPWLQMAYTGVLSTAFCLWVEVVSLRDVSASEAAMVYTLEPLYGAGFAWLLLGERWGPLGWVGAALILGGSVSMQLFGQVDTAEEPDDTPQQQSSAILGALGVAAAVALLMVATGGVPELATHLSQTEAAIAETVATAESVAWSAYGEAETVDNLATFVRAYAMVKGDGVEGEEGEVDAASLLLPLTKLEA